VGILKARLLAAVVVGLGVLAGQVAPAAAETGTITPQLVCEVVNPVTTSVDAVLTYSSSYATTQEFEPGSGQNFFSPGEPDAGQPEAFFSGPGQELFSVRFYTEDTEQLNWVVDGTRLTIEPDGPPCVGGPLWSGAFSDAATYEADDVVGLDGSSWIATTTTDEAPGAGIPGWEPFALAGADGLPGAEGPRGTEGAQGPPGPAGPAGSRGAPGQASPASPHSPSGTYRFGHDGRVTVKDATVTAGSLVVLQYVGAATEPTVLDRVGDGRFTAAGEPGARFRYVVYPGS
jgi:hypothetical protein